MKLLVYVPLLTPRIRYIFNFIFNDILQTQVGFSSNISEFKASALAKITYGDRPVSDELFFRQSDFLLSHTIVTPSFKTTTFGDMIVPFAVDNSSLPFDVFAAAFYFISRYEEYLDYTPDEDGNFPADASLQSELKLMEFPVIDGWALLLKNMLLKRYPALYFAKKQFEFIPLVCLHSNRQQNRNYVSRQLLRLYKKYRPKFGKLGIDPKLSNLRLFLNEQHEKFKLNPVYFFRSTHHLDMICEKQFSFPKSYLHLLKNGGMHDYRMGYSRTIGFRAGTCTPFYWYDLQLEKTTHLQVHPIAINDEILNQHNNPDEIIKKWTGLISNVKLLNGRFYLLLHKDSLPENGKGNMGRHFYQQLLANNLHTHNDL